MIKKRTPGHVRFWSKVQRTDTCWLWTGKISKFGYGRFWDDSQREIMAHRFAFIDAYGTVPDGMLVCHKCDVRHCVRPDHLFPGTQSDNIRDALRKGRFHQIRYIIPGGTGRVPKLTDAQVAEVRRLYFEAGLSQQEIADDLHVSQGTISSIIIKRLQYCRM